MGSPRKRTKPFATCESDELIPKKKAARDESRAAFSMEAGGIELAAKTAGKQGPIGGSGAKHVAVAADPPHIDPDLAELVDSWPKLGPAIKAGIIAMVRSSK